jgi:hypothetical protein
MGPQKFVAGTERRPALPGRLISLPPAAPGSRPPERAPMAPGLSVASRKGGTRPFGRQPSPGSRVGPPQRSHDARPAGDCAPGHAGRPRGGSEPAQGRPGASLPREKAGLQAFGAAGDGYRAKPAQRQRGRPRGRSAQARPGAAGLTRCRPPAVPYHGARFRPGLYACRVRKYRSWHPPDVVALNLRTCRVFV